MARMHTPGDRPGDRVEATRTAAGRVRWITHLAPDRDRLYRRLLAPLVPGIERSLGRGVVANRALGDAPSLRSPRAARRRWRRVLAGRLSPGTFVIASDVRDCYGSIGLPALRAGLAHAGVACPDELEAFLRTSPQRGLPVGPEPSAILANAVLAIPDDAVSRTGATILRWVDDVVIAAPDRAAALVAFAAWRSALTELGLAPNEAKTRPIADGAGARALLLGSAASGADAPVRGIIRWR